MNLLRATVKKAPDWWEMTLLDLAVVVDGTGEDECLRQLEHFLIGEYHLAIRAGRTPFVGLKKGCDAATSQAFSDGSKKFGKLNLPDEVSLMLGAVLDRPKVQQFQVQEQEAKPRIAA